MENCFGREERSNDNHTEAYFLYLMIQQWESLDYYLTGMQLFFLSKIYYQRYSHILHSINVILCQLFTYNFSASNSAFFALLCDPEVDLLDFSPLPVDMMLDFAKQGTGRPLQDPFRRKGSIFLYRCALFNMAATELTCRFLG